MIRLIFADLAANARIWLGILIVTVATGAVGAFAAALIETGVSLGGTTLELLIGLSSSVILLTGITALVVLGSMANLTVSLQQRSYALWQLVGIDPGLTRRVVVTQLAILGLFGAFLGCLCAWPLLQYLFDFVRTPFPGLETVRLAFGAGSFYWVICSTAAIVVLGGWRGARHASRIAPVKALREPEPQGAKMGWVRWVTFGSVVACLSAMMLSFVGADVAFIASQTVFIGPIIAGGLAAIGPILFPALLRAWTAVVPRGASAAWYLARHCAGYRLSQSTAAISPLMVAIAMAGGLYSAGETLANASSVQTNTPQSFAPGVDAVVLILGGPLLLSALGAAMTVFMSGHARRREFALIQSAGGTHRTILAAAIFEAVIYMLTAAILGTFATAATGLITAWAVSTTLPGTAASFGIAPTTAVAGAGLLLLLVATVIPTAVALRHDVPGTLAST